jgi:hypothetical protein
MQEWLSHYFFLVFPLFFVGSWVLTAYWVALTGGWRLLANRFRAQGPFTGRTWRMQSARMRWLCKLQQRAHHRGGRNRTVHGAHDYLSRLASAALYPMD